jgi:hypothetical protein
MVSCSTYEGSESYWGFCPSLAPSYLFLALFATTTVAHLRQAIIYRSPYCWVITMSAFWQTFTYVFHTVSLYYPDNFNYYAIWFVVILVAPLWTNAFVYMVFGRMVWSFRSDGRIWKIKAWQFGMFFVILDIVAFVVQVYGAGQAAGGKDQTNSQTLSALHIYMGGLGIQLFFILTFAIFGLQLFRQLKQSSFNVAGKSEKRSILLMFFAIFLGLGLIVVCAFAPSMFLCLHTPWNLTLSYVVPHRVPNDRVFLRSQQYYSSS